MLEKIDLSQSLKNKEYQNLYEDLSARLGELQRETKRLGIPVIIVFEGWGASGKGTLINRLISPMDPRGFKVFTIKSETQEESMRPFLWRFWTKTPEKGQFAIFDRSWYRRVVNDRIDKKVIKENLPYDYSEILSFEQQLTDDGTVIIKLFIHISEEEQKRRFKKLSENPDTAWRVTSDDWKHNKQYKQYLTAINEMLEQTDSENAPWNIIEGNDHNYAVIKTMHIVIDALANQINKVNEAPKPDISPMVPEDNFRTSLLSNVDLTKTLTKEVYQKKLAQCQKKLAVLHNRLYLKRTPVIIVFEGWDAAGKGGAIKRLTQNLDPRGYEVIPTPAPTPTEKAHHYLWRFWNTIPKAGHIAIYDRSWYGRVMVERIEGFCTVDEWQRAYSEINQMEEHLTNFGAIVIKFWLHIDKHEQEKRFNARMIDPKKQWKITDEDWRNREKWDQYYRIVDEMLLRTSTTYAPWTIVEANSKRFARIRVLEKIIEELEKKL